MTRIEQGSIVTLFLATIGLAFWMGQLQQQVDSFDIRKINANKDRAIAEIQEAGNEIMALIREQQNRNIPEALKVAEIGTNRIDIYPRDIQTRTQGRMLWPFPSDDFLHISQTMWYAIVPGCKQENPSGPCTRYTQQEWMTKYPVRNLDTLIQDGKEPLAFFPIDIGQGIETDSNDIPIGFNVLWVKNLE